MEIGWFLNHSETPNIIKKSDGLVYAVTDIQAGDEILMDYNQLNEPESMKESYYKNKDVST
jgi:SET domain-containing protein